MSGLIWVLIAFVLINVGLIILTQVPALAHLKTKIVGIVLAGFGGLQTYGIDFISDPKIVGAVATGTGITIIVLRELTKKSYEK